MTYRLHAQASVRTCCVDPSIGVSRFSKLEIGPVSAWKAGWKSLLGMAPLVGWSVIRPIQNIGMTPVIGRVPMPRHLSPIGIRQLDLRRLSSLSMRIVMILSMVGMSLIGEMIPLAPGDLAGVPPIRPLQIRWRSRILIPGSETTVGNTGRS